MLEKYQQKIFDLPPEIKRELKSQDAEQIFKNREEVKGITIDGAYTKDRDDAIYIKRNAKGYLVDISITDISALIKKHSRLDKEAKKIGFTRYNNHEAPLKMFPAELSEDLLSLNRGIPRPTITIRTQLDQSFMILEDPTVLKTYINILRNFTYDEINSILNGSNALGFNQDVNWCVKTANTFFNIRRNQEAIAYYNFQKQIRTGEKGTLKHLDGHAEWIIMEFMIFANIQIAKITYNEQINSIYRNHNPALPALEIDRKQMLNDLYLALSTNNNRRMNEILPHVYRILSTGASYATKPHGHFGLNLDYYTHFTSPIRRYADTIVQNVLNAYIEENRTNFYSLNECKNICRSINAIKKKEKYQRSWLDRRNNSRNQKKQRIEQEKTLEELFQYDRIDEQDALQIMQLIKEKKIDSELIITMFIMTKGNKNGWKKIWKYGIDYLSNKPDEIDILVAFFEKLHNCQLEIISTLQANSKKILSQGYLQTKIPHNENIQIQSSIIHENNMIFQSTKKCHKVAEMNIKIKFIKYILDLEEINPLNN